MESLKIRKRHFRDKDLYEIKPRPYIIGDCGICGSKLGKYIYENETIPKRGILCADCIVKNGGLYLYKEYNKFVLKS